MLQPASWQSRDNRAATRIPPNLSLYLDLLRLAAALVVFLTHTHNFLFRRVNFGALASGREAVAVFFVLSGFVISAVVSSSESDLTGYALARVARILPVAVLAMLVTWVADTIGLFFHAHYYQGLTLVFHDFYRPETFQTAWSYLTFTNQRWLDHTVFGSNEPYWSLGFEVPYYIFFGLVSFVPKRLGGAALGVWALFYGPRILLFLPLWLLGVLAHRLVSGRYRPGLLLAAFLYGLSLVLPFVLGASVGRLASSMFGGTNPWQIGYDAVYFTCLGLLTGVNLVAFHALAGGSDLRVPHTVARSIRWLAGGSFTLYLVHQPLLVTVSSFLQPASTPWMIRAIAVAGVLVCSFGLAELAERRKRWFSQQIQRLFGYPRRVGLS